MARILGTSGDDFLQVALGGIRRYEVIRGLYTWEQAKADAQARGGHLATITSEEEWNTIKEQLGSALEGRLWLGASDAQQDTWEWVTGEPWSYTQWNPFSLVVRDPEKDYYLSLRVSDSYWRFSSVGEGDYLLEAQAPSNVAVNSFLSGGAGNDTLLGGAGGDTLDGGTGADSMMGGGGDDLYLVDDSSDILTEDSGAGSDMVRSSVTHELGANFEDLELLGLAAVNGTGNDLANAITGNDAANLLSAGDGSDTLNGRGGNDTLVGYWGNDVLDGDAGNDSLEAGNGADTLEGGGGNDTLVGWDDADRMAGGEGDDLYVVDNVGDAITEIAGEGSDSVVSSVTHSLAANVEDLVLTGGAEINGTGNALANQVTGNAAANRLFAGAGNDRVWGGAGNDYLDGGLANDSLSGGGGNDTYLVDSADDVVVEVAGGGFDTVQSLVTHTLGANVEHLELVGSAAINGTGNALANQMTGNAAANRLSAGAGNDRVWGGGGNDTLNAGLGLDTVKGEAGNDLLRIDWSSLIGATISRSIRKDGTGTAASFSGSYVAKNASGAVLAQVNFDTIERLALNSQPVDLEDVVNVFGVTIKRVSTATATTEQGGVVEYNVVLGKAPFEDVTLNFASSDTTEGKVNTPRLTFTPQNWNSPQRLIVQGVDDYLDDGNLAYTVTGKIVTEDLNYNRLTVSALNLINKDDGEDKPLNLKGTPNVDRLVGKNGNDRIYGEGDQDSLLGGRGDDLLYGQEDDDRMFGEEGNDKLYGGYDNDRMDGGLGADSLFGEQGLDTLIGGAGNDYLDGGIENDSMSGGAGNDTYFVDSAGDKINDLGLTTDVDTVLLLQTVSYALPANVENASINAAAGNASLTGNGLDNRLAGNDSRNVLDGGSGNDVLAGGGGNDTMRGGAGVDVADFAAAGVNISIDLNTGRAEGEGTDLIFGIENILAGDGRDTLLGNAAGNDLDGGAGTDNLNGGGGNDTLAGCFFGANGGRAEIDTLTGGVGLDVFQLGWASGRFYDDGNTRTAGRNDYVLITDFTVGQDRLQLDGAAGNYYLGASGVSGVSGIGLYAEQGATDELIAIIRSASSTTLTSANTINTAQFV